MTKIVLSEACRNLSHLVNQAADGRKPVVITSRGNVKAIIVSIEGFEKLIVVHDYAQRALMPPEQLHQEFRQALAEAG